MRGPYLFILVLALCGSLVSANPRLTPSMRRSAEISEEESSQDSNEVDVSENLEENNYESSENDSEIDESSENGSESDDSSSWESEETNLVEDENDEELNMEEENYPSGEVLSSSVHINPDYDYNYLEENLEHERRERIKRFLRPPKNTHFRKTVPFNHIPLKTRLSCADSPTAPPKEASSWSLDSGTVPESLKASGNNDGLAGLPQKPQFGPSEPSDNGPSAQFASFETSSTEEPDFSFGDEDNADPQSSDFSSENFGSNDEDPFGSNDQSGSTFGSDTQGDGDSSFGNDDAEVNGEPDLDCTCVSILQCGGTLRSGSNTDQTCEREGEVCCIIANTQLPVTTEEYFDEQPPKQTSNLLCGESKPVQLEEASQAITDTTAQFGEFPWTVLLTSTGEPEENGKWTYRCSGSLIHPTVVLTAAHCLDNHNPKTLVITAGDWDLNRDEVPNEEPLPYQTRNVERILLHPKYKIGLPVHDIALLFLKTPLELTDNVNTICLPTGNDDIEQSKCIASGWGNFPGDDNEQEQQNLQKRIVMPLVPKNHCERALRETRLGKYFRLNQNLICAGGDYGKDVCEGDGGGPLMCPLRSGESMVLTGITSWGVDCGKLGIPGVFVDVAKYVSWIQDNLPR